MVKQPTLGDYRSLRFYHKEKHIERLVDIERILDSVRMHDYTTMNYINSFIKAENELKLAHDMLTHRLDEAIQRLEAADDQP